MDIIARNKSIRYLKKYYINILKSHVRRKTFNKKITKKKKNRTFRKTYDEKQDAVNIFNQRTDKIPVIAIDNYNITLKEYDNIYAASKALQINSGIIIYS